MAQLELPVHMKRPVPRPKTASAEGPIENLKTRWPDNGPVHSPGAKTFRVPLQPRHRIPPTECSYHPLKGIASENDGVMPKITKEVIMFKSTNDDDKNPISNVDDLDVEMPAEDYGKFTKRARKRLREKLEEGRRKYGSLEANHVRRLHAEIARYTIFSTILSTDLSEWRSFCEDNHWDDRRIRPKKEDWSEAGRWLGLWIVAADPSDKATSKRASKIAKILQFFLVKGTPPEDVVNVICDNGGIDGLYPIAARELRTNTIAMASDANNYLVMPAETEVPGPFARLTGNIVLSEDFQARVERLRPGKKFSCECGAAADGDSLVYTLKLPKDKLAEQETVERKARKKAKRKERAKRREAKRKEANDDDWK